MVEIIKSSGRGGNAFSRRIVGQHGKCPVNAQPEISRFRTGRWQTAGFGGAPERFRLDRRPAKANMMERFPFH
jgi:hypothetical protein